MIQEKEIRIGNWFNHNLEWNYSGNTGYFQWSDRDWYAVGECTLFLENVSCITLTELWLRNFGFTNGLLPEMYHSPDINYHVVKHGDKFIFRGLGASIVEFKTVHHLQNLYYFLTGTELEVKS